MDCAWRDSDTDDARAYAREQAKWKAERADAYRRAARDKVSPREARFARAMAARIASQSRAGFAGAVISDWARSINMAGLCRRSGDLRAAREYLEEARNWRLGILGGFI